MAMTETRVPFTRADYFQLPEGFPAELVEGQLVREPAPFYRHQRVSMRLTEILLTAVGGERVVCSPIDVVLDDLNVLQPDVAVYTEPLAAEIDLVPVPALVIEVLSPSTARRDRDQKAALYLRHGVAEVWLVHPFDGTVEVATPDGRRLYASEQRVTSVSIAGLAVVGTDLVR